MKSTMTSPNAGSVPTHLSWVWLCLFLLVGGTGVVSMDFYALPKADMIQFDSATDTVIVGGRRRLVELSMDLKEEKQSTVVGSLGTFDDLEECRKQLQVLRREDQIPYYCHYDVTLVLLPKVGATNSLINTTQSPVVSFPASETLLYCSTTDNVAVCVHVERSNFSKIIRYIPGLEYSSLHSDVPTEALVGSDGNFWGISATATRTKVDFVRADYSLERQKSVWLTQESERVHWFRDSGYASIIEEEDYVYLFFWERALENNDMPVARVARVCKTDAGIYDTRLKYNVFSSFVKVQLQCSSEPVQSDTATTKVYTFIADVFRVNGTLDQMTFTDLVYAVFQASSPLDSDGPTASALCVFDFAKIRTALDSTRLTNLRTLTPVNKSPSINCASASTRSINDVTEVTLSPEVVRNEQSQLLHLVADGERFLRVVVDQATSLDGLTYDVIFVLSTHKFFEKLYLYKVTYGTGRRSNVRKVSYKVEVMADEALLKKNEEVYGKYLPHEGNRMELHHQGDNTLLYITSEAGVFRLRTDDCSHYTSCGDCVAAQDPHCAFDRLQGMCVSIKTSNNSNELLQDTNNGDTTVCNNVTANPITNSSSPTSDPATTTTAPSTSSPSSSPTSPTSPGPPIGSPTDGGPPNVGNLTTPAPVLSMTNMWWAIVVPLVSGLAVGFIVGLFVSLFYQWKRATKAKTASPIKMASSADPFAIAPLTATNDKHRGSGRGSRRGSEQPGVKPNNAVDWNGEAGQDPVVEPKGHHGNKQLSPEPCGKGPAITAVPVMHSSQSNHSSLLGNKSNDPPTSDSAVSVPHNPNLADSSSDSPESPVANWAREHFKANIDSVDKDYKVRHTSTSSTGAVPWEHPSSQVSYSACYNGAIGNTGTLPRSQPPYPRATSVGPVRPLSLSRLSYTSSHGGVDGYPVVGSPMSVSGRIISLTQQRQSLLATTPDPQPNGHITIAHAESYDC